MSTDYMSASTTLSDHDLTLAIPGDVGGVRPRLMRPQPAFTASVTTALPPPANASITEGTTELLVSISDRRVAEPIRRKDVDTAEIDTDRLM